MDRTHTEMTCSGWWWRGEEKEGKKTRTPKTEQCRYPPFMYTECVCVRVNDEGGDAAQLLADRAGPEVAEWWCGGGVRGGGVRARLLVGAVVRMMEVLARLRCIDVLCKGRTRMKGGFLGDEGPRGQSRPLSPCSLLASGICPQAFSGTLGTSDRRYLPTPGDSSQSWVCTGFLP